MPHSSSVTAPCEPGAEARLELVELLGGEARRGLPALQRLEEIVRPDVDLGRVPGRSIAERRPLLPRRERQEERDPEQEVRRDPLDVPGVAAGERGDVPVGEHVADAAVDHPGRVAARPDPVVGLLEEQDPKSAHGTVASRAGPVHAAAEDDDVEVHSSGPRRPLSVTRGGGGGPNLLAPRAPASPRFGPGAQPDRAVVA